ncbi:MAG: hypothetical protein AAGE52_21175 [Myxococcota bacterium]
MSDEALALLEGISLEDEWTDEVHMRVVHALRAATNVLKDAKQPSEQRTRAAKAYYRCAARDALIGNDLTEYQKAWRVRWAKGRGAAALVLEAWIASDDIHAPLVAALAELRPDLKPKEVAALVGTVIEGTSISELDEIESTAKGTGNKIRKAVAKAPELAEATARWLLHVAEDDLRRRVLHAGSVLSAAADRRLEDIVATLPPDRVEWARAVWSYTAPR